MADAETGRNMPERPLSESKLLSSENTYRYEYELAVITFYASTNENGNSKFDVLSMPPGQRIVWAEAIPYSAKFTERESGEGKGLRDLASMEYQVLIEKEVR